MKNNESVKGGSMNILELRNIYGINRVLSPPNVLPQAAYQLDVSLPINDYELLIEVEVLNIDSASFRQIVESNNYDGEEIKKTILKIIKERGKMQNPLTGSGGMLIGQVKEIGKYHPANNLVKVGDRIATLVSLTLTPLIVERIKGLDLKTGQVKVEGQAILFSSGIFAKLPNDLSESVALAVLDVAGAPAQTRKLVEKGQTVVILGAGGKSGLLSLYQAKQKVGDHGKVIAVENSKAGIEILKKLNLADEIINVSANNPLELLTEILKVTEGKLADTTINCVNVPDTEMSSILITKDKGTVYFFSMATSFSKAALGAEGVGKDLTLIIGNGYTSGHAEIALNTLREYQPLYKYFQEKYN